MTAEVEVDKKPPTQEQKTVANDEKKPVESVTRPSRADFNTTVSELDSKIKVCKAELDSVKESLDKMAEAKKSGDKSNEPQLKLNELRTKTRAVMDERKKMFEQLKKNKEARQKLRDSNDSMRKSLSDAGGCYSVADVEKKIRDLEYYLATNALSVKEEKVVIKDIKNLTNSKKTIGEYDTLKGRKDAVESTSKEISQKLDASKIELEKAKSAEDAQYKIVAEIRAKNNTKAEYQALFKRRDVARKEQNSLYDNLRKVRDTFRKQEDAWHKMMNEKRKEQRERRKAEEEQYKEEMRLEKLKKEEEAEESLHAEKFASIDQLISYLKRFSDGPAKVEEAAPVEVQKVEGMTLIGKRTRVMEDDFYNTKKGKKGKGKKKGGKNKPQGGMSHDIKVLQEFEALKVDAPLSKDNVEATITALNAKTEELKKDKASRREKRLKKVADAEADLKAKNEKKAADAKLPANVEGAKEEDVKVEEAKAEDTKADEAKPEDGDAKKADE